MPDTTLGNEDTVGKDKEKKKYQSKKSLCHSEGCSDQDKYIRVRSDKEIVMFINCSPPHQPWSNLRDMGWV